MRMAAHGRKKTANVPIFKNKSNRSGNDKMAHSIQGRFFCMFSLVITIPPHKKSKGMTKHDFSNHDHFLFLDSVFITYRNE